MSGGKISTTCARSQARADCCFDAVYWGWPVAALLQASEADHAPALVTKRAEMGSAAGYRFPAFMPHLQDYEVRTNRSLRAKGPPAALGPTAR
jgi:hypothetical protein